MAKWWLVSWTTDANWLPGDKRGYCTPRGKTYIPPPKRYANPGEGTYQVAKHQAALEAAEAICDYPVYFAPREKEIAFRAMIAEIDQIQIVPAVISLGRWHVHWPCYFGRLGIRKIVARVKAAASRELNANGFHGKRPWAKGCNIKSKATR